MFCFLTVEPVEQLPGGIANEIEGGAVLGYKLTAIGRNAKLFYKDTSFSFFIIVTQSD